ncbi:septation inhibitor protein [Lasius niger]|uniref:Septation inhibitor protein n=1 Tax=Lasius niger TaxID=67767 RepID=A0A0J7K2B5_LASNI|nr:septation inhibitor protein [Lasius niger]
MPKNSPSASYPPAPSTEAALRKNQYEKETLQDGIWIVGGIFIALLFIGLASYIVRYVASRPSNTLVSGEIIGLSSPKDHPVVGKLIKNRKIETSDDKCKKLDGKAFRLKPGKSVTAYFRGNVGSNLSFELMNVPELSNCPYEMVLTPAQARIAMGVYTQQHQMTDTIVSALPFTEEDIKSADTDDKLAIDENNNTPEK